MYLVSKMNNSNVEATVLVRTKYNISGSGLSMHFLATRNAVGSALTLTNFGTIGNRMRAVQGYINYMLVISQLS